MRFRLVEFTVSKADSSWAIKDAAKKEKKKYEDAVKEAKKKYKEAKDSKEKDNALKELLSAWGFSDNFQGDDFKSIRFVIDKSIRNYGDSLTTNKFLSYLKKNGSVLKQNYDTKVSILQNLINLGLIEYNDSQDWFSKGSLYEREDDEFEYTVKIFDIASNPSLASKYFKTTEYTDDKGNKKSIDVKDLYLSANKIKDSGLRDHKDPKKRNIWNQVELWAKRFGEIGREEGEGQGKYSLNNLFTQIYKISEEDTEKKKKTLYSILEKEGILSERDIADVQDSIENRMEDSDVEKMLNEKAFNTFGNKSVSEFIKKKFNL